MSFVSYLANEISYLFKTDTGSVIKQPLEKVEESKCPRDPRPLITIHHCLNRNFNPYDTYYSELHMVLVSKNEGVISIPTCCRDFFNQVIRHQLFEEVSGSSYAVRAAHGMIDRDSLRVGLLLDQPYNNRIKVLDGLMNGVRVANMYGRVAGWQPLEIEHCRIEQKRREDPTDFYIMVGDANWQRTPQYISMLILIIRLCLRYQVPLWIKDAYSMQTWWHELIYKENRQPTPDVDTFLNNSYGSLLTLVAHDEEIFPHDMEGGYNPKIESFHGKSGLNSLVTGNSSHPDSTKKLIQLRRYDSGKV